MFLLPSKCNIFLVQVQFECLQSDCLPVPVCVHRLLPGTRRWQMVMDVTWVWSLVSMVIWRHVHIPTTSLPICVHRVQQRRTVSKNNKRVEQQLKTQINIYKEAYRKWKDEKPRMIKAPNRCKTEKSLCEWELYLCYVNGPFVTLLLLNLPRHA